MRGRTDDEDAEGVRAGMVGFLEAVTRDDTSAGAALAGAMAAVCEMAWACRTPGLSVDELVAAVAASARSFFEQIAEQDDAGAGHA